MEVKNNYFCFVALMFICAITIPAVNGEFYSKTTSAELRVQKRTTLHFYLHDTLSGKNPSAVLVAKPNETFGNKSVIPFGSVYAIDDPITVGPEPNSTVIGNARGLYVSSSKDELSIVMYVDFGFTAGKFNGSSISVSSRNPVSDGDNREVAVVGGRLRFRMAQGYAKLKTSFLDMKTGDAVIEWFVTVYHY